MIAEGITKVSSVDTSNHLVTHFRHYLTVERSFSKHTGTNYQSDLVTLACWILDRERPLERSGHDAILKEAEEALRDVEREQLLSFKTWIESQKLSISTVARCLSAIRSFYKFLQRKDYRKDNPASTLKMPKIPKKKRMFLSDEQVALLLSAVSTDKGDEVLMRRDYAMLRLIVETGLQVQKTVDLNIVDFDAATLKIKVRESDKSNHGREMPVSAVCQKAIQEYLNARSGSKTMGTGMNAVDAPLFVNKHGNRLSERSIRRKLEKWASRAGLGQSISPRCLRYNFVAKARNEMDTEALKEALGHQSRATTLETVAHLSQI